MVTAEEAGPESQRRFGEGAIRTYRGLFSGINRWRVSVSNLWFALDSPRPLPRDMSPRSGAFRGESLLMRRAVDEGGALILWGTVRNKVRGEKDDI